MDTVKHSSVSFSAAKQLMGREQPHQLGSFFLCITTRILPLYVTIPSTTQKCQRLHGHIKSTKPVQSSSSKQSLQWLCTVGLFRWTCVWAKARVWKKIIKYCCASNESQGTHCQHIMGHVMGNQNAGRSVSQSACAIVFLENIMLSCCILARM